MPHVSPGILSFTAQGCMRTLGRIRPPSLSVVVSSAALCHPQRCAINAMSATVGLSVCAHVCFQQELLLLGLRSMTPINSLDEERSGPHMLHTNSVPQGGSAHALPSDCCGAWPTRDGFPQSTPLAPSGSV